MTSVDSRSTLVSNSICTLVAKGDTHERNIYVNSHMTFKVHLYLAVGIPLQTMSHLSAAFAATLAGCG